MFIYQQPFSAFGFAVDHSYISLNHQSNGQAGELSRSWNRIIGSVIFSHENFIWGLEAWWRIPEEEKSSVLDPTGDDNPDIYPFHLKMHDSAGIRNAFKQGID